MIRSLALFFATLPLACAASPAAPAPLAPAAAANAAAIPDAAAAVVHVQVLAINDLHGHLLPPAGTNGIVFAPSSDPIASLPGAKPIDDGGITMVPAGGAAYLAAHLAALRAQNPNTVVVSAGDLTGASPLLSNLFNDEPTILVMNRAGLDLEAVGNHDFDRGRDELVRLQRGGCARGECDGGAPFPGASFTYLAANVIDDATNKSIFPPYAMKELGGVKVAFIGEVLRQTPTMTPPAAVKGLTFEDEASVANALVPELRRAGAEAIVLLLHQGGTQSLAGTYDSCVGFSGELSPILDALDPAIDVVVSAHTHQAYNCTIGGRLVTSAGSYGRLVTQIDLAIDPGAGRVVDKSARNVAVTRDVAPDPGVAAIVETYEAKAAPRTGRVVGYVREDFLASAKAARSASCETPLGDLLADAQQAATGADVAFINPGGIRADLVAKRSGRPDGAVTYAEAFEVQPFGNHLVTMTLTGAQLRTILEGQFGSRADPRILQPSRGLSYRYAYDRAARHAVIEDLRLRGAAVAPAKKYRVTVNSFLAAGGDGFAVLKEGENRKEAGLDLDALVAYLGAKSSAKAPLAPSTKEARVEGDGCK